jgi:hypothetical protein
MAAEEKSSDEELIPFIPFGSIMTTMGFLKTEIAEDSEDYLLATELWTLLVGEGSGTTKYNLLKILLVIRGV